jgi:hypothetical protein
MVGPMFLVSLHHMFLLLYAARLHGDLLPYKSGQLVMLDKGDRKL